MMTADWRYAELALALTTTALLRYCRRSPRLFWAISLPGTLLHELFHGVAAFIFGARPGFPSLMLRRLGPDRWMLGSLPCANLRWWNAAGVSLAPLLLIPFGFAVLLWPGERTFAVFWIPAGLLAGEAWAAALPSDVDWRLAGTSLAVLLFGFGAGIFALYH